MSTPTLSLRGRATAWLAARLRRAAGTTPAQREAGLSTPEFLICFTVVLMAIFTILHTVLWWHATHVAQTAAARALEDTRAYNGSALAGDKTGQEQVRALGGRILHDVEVHSVRTATGAQVEITGTVQPVIPGWAWTVHVTVTGPVETFQATP